MLTHDLLIRLDRARQQLAEISDPLPSIDEVARTANLSQGHFIRRFAAVFGETPHQFRIRARLEKAKELLVLGEDSVTEVCMSVGFSSLGSFTWLFSQRFGEPPSSYRRRLLPSVEIPGQLPPHLVPGCMTLMVAAWRTAQFSRSVLAGEPVSIGARGYRGSPCGSN